MAELRQIDFDDLMLGKGVAFKSVLKRYSGKKRFNNIDIQTNINIKANKEIPMIEIDLSSEFRFPGSPTTDPKRKISMRGYAFPEP
jgi:hypothetical protein